MSTVQNVRCFIDATIDRCCREQVHALFTTLLQHVTTQNRERTLDILRPAFTVGQLAALVMHRRVNYVPICVVHRSLHELEQHSRAWKNITTAHPQFTLRHMASTFIQKHARRSLVLLDLRKKTVAVLTIQHACIPWL